MIYTLILKPVLYIYEGFFVHPSPKSDKHSTFLPILHNKELVNNTSPQIQTEAKLLSIVLFPVSSTIKQV